MAKEIWGYARVSTKEQSLERQLVALAEHSEAEVAEKIAKELNGHGRLKKKERKYCIVFLSQAQQNKKAGC